MPTRSTGCATCRKRKVRCDEARPGCKRCAIHRVKCPGYRQDRDGLNPFMDETQTIIQKANQKYGLSTKKSPWSSSSTPTSSDSSSPQPDDFSLVPSRSSSFFNAVSSPVLESQQLFNQFLALYLPKMAPWNQVDHSSFFQSLAVQWPSNRALRHGMDAISLAQLGSVNRDQRLLKQAVRSYGQALAGLAQHIKQGDFLHDDDVLITVSLLTMCELYGEIANVGGWVSHVEGTNRLVAARGPERMTSPTAMLLYSNMRHGAIVQALIARRAPFLASPEWRAVAFNMPAYLQDNSTTFNDMAIQVPGLLERFDNLDFQAPSALLDVVGLMAEVNAIVRQLRAWYDDVEVSFRQRQQLLYEVKPIEDFVGFSTLCSDRTFEEAYAFADFYMGYLFSIYWICLFNLHETLQQLQRYRRELDGDWFLPPESVVTDDDVLSDILDVCRCIPFFCEASTGAAGTVAIFLPLRTIALYFVYHGHWNYLKWVNAMRTTVFVKGLEPPSVGMSNLLKSPPAKEVGLQDADEDGSSAADVASRCGYESVQDR